MRLNYTITLPIALVLAFAAIITLGSPGSEGTANKAQPKNAVENEGCLRCHGQNRYTYLNTESGDTVVKRMYQECTINRNVFYSSIHGNFKCIDCHSVDYDTFPHPGRLRMETAYTCNDCHADDPMYAKFNFEQITTDFEASVHSTKHSKEFTCWMCHNPHSYVNMARNEKDIHKTIEYSNSICLACHANKDQYQLLTNKDNPNILEKHEWLPNQASHFRSVRCIECHSAISDSTLVAHNIQTKDKAVKNCVECHSSNSRLMATLYKHEIQQQRNKAGFINSGILESSYVIGANRNYYLNILSLVIFGGTLLGIVIHTSLRILKRKKNV